MQTETAVPATRNLRPLKGSSSGLLFMLILQFALGASYAIYGTRPTASASLKPFSEGPLLIIHVILGILLIVAAVVLVVQAVMAKHGLAIGTSVVGLLALVGAAGGGFSALGHGHHAASLGMAIGTAIAMVCYAVNVRVL